MATKKLFFLFSILLSMVGTKALAYDFAVENADGVTIYYNYINDATELEVTRCSFDGPVVIPQQVTYMNRTRKVTSIGKKAFYDCSGLTSVTIPNSVTSIGDWAFSGCSSLTSITIPSSVTSIGEAAFFGCYGLTSVHISDLDSWCKISFDYNPLFYAHHLYLNGEEIKDLVIPNSVTSISSGAFQNCTGLTSVTIPKSVTSIGGGAFAECRCLKNVTIANSVTSIGDGTFRLCLALTSITIPNSVTSIGDYAFQGCNRLTSVTIGNSVSSIGDWAFANCGSLISVTIPNSVTSIGQAAFYDCSIIKVISKIENLFDISINTFTDYSYNNAKLFVPEGYIDLYKTTEGWKKFVFIEEGAGGGDNPNPEPQKCEKPTISFKDGVLVFSCATEGVTYQYNITASSASSGAGNNIDFVPQYTITVYATKDGYENSDTASLVVTGGATGDLNGDGFINAADATVLVKLIMEQ